MCYFTADRLFECLESRQLLSTFTVLNTNDAGSGSLRQAVFDANNAAGADIIEFDGSLSGSTVSLYSGELAITDDLTINGLGADVLTIDAGNSSRIFANSASTSISGLQIINGYGYGGTPNGGAIHNTGDLALSSVTIRWNYAEDGGSIYNADGTLTISDSTVANNTALYGGGGIFNATGTVVITGSTITENIADSGGAIINANFDGGQDQFGGTVVLDDSTVSNNAANYGGGVWSSGELSLVDSTVSNNTASRSAAGIYNAFGTLAMTRAIVSGNDAARNGGGVFNSGEATITDSTLSGNAADLGGGVYNAVGTIVARGSFFSTNTAQTTGGGIYTRTGGTISISVSTISDNDSVGGGGGLYALESTVSLADSTISGNTAQAAGGGLSSNNTSMTLTNVLVTGNSTEYGSGGGIHHDHDVLIITSSTISRNSAQDSRGGGLFNGAGSTVQMTDIRISENAASRGGGISNQGTLALTNSTVSENTAGFAGGGIETDTGTLSLTDSTVTGNTAGVNGGGIDNFSTLTLINVTVSGNAAQYGAGILNWDTLTIATSTIEGNIASESGGGIYNDPGSGPETTLSVTNSTISGNDARDGGGIYSATGAVVVANSTISGNSVSGEGGGIYNYDSALSLTNATVTSNLGGGGLHLFGGATTLKSTIVAGNTGGDVLNGTLHPSSSHNLIQDAASSGGLLDGINSNIVGENPLLSPLADNGGPTQTHGLMAFSPALNNGLNDTGLATDQRGSVFRRAFGGAPDIGAFERQSLSLKVSTTADEVDGDYSFGEFSLREAVELTNASPGVDDIGFEEILRGETLVLGGTQLAITDDVTITGLGAQDLTIDADGGSAVFLNSGAATTISGLAITGGGTSGIRNTDGTLTLSGVVITGNATPSDGGGIQNTGGTLTITDSTIEGNTAGNAGGGGGIFSFQGVVTITGSTISGNAAGEGGSGGGILSGNGALTVIDSTVSGNAAVAGGGIYSINGTLTLTGSTVSGNSATADGGGVLSIGTLAVRNSTISGNSANGSGGGVSVGSGTAAISNSTIANNVADADANGAGMGGGIHVIDSTLTTTSSIYAGNNRGTSGSITDDIDSTNSTISGAHNLVQDTASAGGLIDGTDANIVGADPMLAVLASNGGSTMTHALLPGSPAVDSGSNPDALGSDQRGASRSRGEAPDIGAFEATARPTLGGLSAATAELAQGTPFTLVASSAADSDGSVVEVRFYIDSNGDGIAQDSELLGADADGSGGFRLVVTAGQTASLPLGPVPFLAVAVDDEGFMSPTRSAFATVLFSINASEGAVPTGSSTADDTLWTGVVNRAGEVILFESAGGTVVHLGVAAGAPRATGDVTVFTDPKDGLIYAAFPSAEGLILAQRSGNGFWSIRNLSDESGLMADAGPTRALSQFVSTAATGRVAVIVGIDGSGHLVACQQSGSSTDGAWDWSFVDISGDLASQGMATPVFTDLITYVTRWNAWNIAGIDANGDIQGIWVAPASFTTWRIDNLSDITGAPPISGQLTVTLTSWSAINLGGVDESGHLVVTWWVPSFKGNWVTSDLTTVSAGEALTAGRATGFVTPWGAINYAGTNAAGDVTVYWWTPQTGGWLVSPLTAGLAGVRPTGQMTSHVSATGTMSILGSADGGEVIRVWWSPNDDGRWKLTDLSGEAVRA